MELIRPTKTTKPYKLGMTVVGPLRFYPPYTNGLVVQGTVDYMFSQIIYDINPKCPSPHPPPNHYVTVSYLVSLLGSFDQLLFLYMHPVKNKIKFVCDWAISHLSREDTQKIRVF